MATNKIQTGIRFEPELLYKISRVAKANMRSVANSNLNRIRFKKHILCDTSP